MIRDIKIKLIWELVDGIGVWEGPFVEVWVGEGEVVGKEEGDGDGDG
jgi:hypothetical protein